MTSKWEAMPSLNRDDQRPLHAQLCAIIADFIEAHDLPPGCPLPTEIELMERLGLSRSPVRQAIQQLENSGFVYKVQGKGTFVSAFKHRKKLQAFKSIEPGLAEQGQTVTNIVLDVVDGYPPEWALDLGFPPEKRVRIFERLKKLQDRPLALEIRVLHPDVAEVLTEEDLAKRPFYDVLESTLKTKIQHLTYALTALEATPRLAEDMGVALGTALLVRRGLYYTLTHEVIMASKVFFVAERIELRFDFDRNDDNWGIILI